MLNFKGWPFTQYLFVIDSGCLVKRIRIYFPLPIKSKL